MPLVDAPTDRRNKILIRGGGAVGLIIAAFAVYSYVRPALQIEQPDGDVLFTLSDHGAIGVQSGSGVSFGTGGDCLQSGGASGNTMLWSSCASGGGISQSAADARYVNTSGDTMTGALKVRASLSGSTLTADNLNVANCDVKSTNGVLSCGLDATSAAVAGQGLTKTGDVFSLNTTISGSLVRFLTLSGSTVYAKNSIRSSGSLVIDTTALIKGNLTTRSVLSGASLVVSNLISCPNLQTASNGALSCNNTSYQPLDATLTALAAFNTNGILVQTAGDTFVGRTITGTSNRITIGNGDGVSANPSVDISSSYVGQTTITTLGTLTTSPLAGVALNIAGVGSGRIIRAQDTLSSSGTLVWEGAASGAILVVSSQFSGAGLTDCDAALTSKLLWDATTKRFSCGADTNTTYTAGQGLTLTANTFSLSSTFSGTFLEIMGTSSGRILHAQDTLTSSGGLVFEGSASGASLWVARFSGAGLSNCVGAGQAVTWNSTTSKFGCASPTGTTYTAAQNLTLSSNAFSLSASFSGSRLVLGNSKVSKGPLTVYGSGAFTSFLSGSALNIQGGTSFIRGNLGLGGDVAPITPLEVRGTISGTLLTINGGSSGISYLMGNVGIGTTAPKAKLDVQGTISGASLTINGLVKKPQTIPYALCNGSTSCATGTGINIPIPHEMDGFALSGATVFSLYPGTTGAMNMQLRNVTQAKDMFTTLAIGSTRSKSGAVINATNRIINDGDQLAVFVSSVSTTPQKGVTILFYFVPR